ncbi:MAG: hypothetical protein PHT33_00330 [bacterium]|nr:hypothetical protein [bacterium]
MEVKAGIIGAGIGRIHLEGYQAALDSFSTGTVRLSSGTFSIVGTITLAGAKNIVGSGYGTILSTTSVVQLDSDSPAEARLLPN